MNVSTLISVLLLIIQMMTPQTVTFNVCYYLTCVSCLLFSSNSSWFPFPVNIFLFLLLIIIFKKKSKRNKQKRNWSLFAGCICYPYGVYFLGGHSNKMVIINWHHVVICAFFLSIRAIWPTGLIVMIDCTEAEPLSHFCRRVTSPSRRRVPVDSHRENGRLYGSTFRIRAVGQ